MLCHGETLGPNRQQIKKISYKTSGFNLIELMIVVTIAAILATLTLPIYSHHLAKKKRLRAELTLQRISSALEEYFVVNYSYEHFSLSDFGFPETLPHSQYRLAIHANAGHFRVIATPFGTQAKRDSRCGALSVTDMGERNISGPGNATKCWMG